MILKRWSIRRFKRKIEKQFLDVLISDYHNWEFGRHTTKHVKTGLKLWTANGYSSFKVYECDFVELSESIKKRLWEWIELAYMMQIIGYEYSESEKENINKINKKEIIKEWSRLQN